MDYVKPYGVVESMLAGAALKLNIPPQNLVIRWMLAGAYLGVATSMAVSVAVETGFWIAGALLFPFGLALAILLGMEIITGSFALIPCTMVSANDHTERVGIRRVLANWGWVFLGNLLGSTIYAALLAIVLTTGGDAPVSAVGTKLIAIAEAKATYYAHHGDAGLLTVCTKAILCNWMVGLAVVFAYSTTSFIGKMFAIWGPTVLFFSQGFEHAVVNMFLIPVGGMFFTRLAMYYAHGSASIAPQQVQNVKHASASLSAKPGGNVCL
ncbi:MAG: formate transporter [Nitrospirales bacterium]|nr:MAG: formate transporter [Nitrospirales bacterium]